MGQCTGHKGLAHAGGACEQDKHVKCCKDFSVKMFCV
jgi:hypothetical protein